MGAREKDDSQGLAPRVNNEKLLKYKQDKKHYQKEKEEINRHPQPDSKRRRYLCNIGGYYRRREKEPISPGSDPVGERGKKGLKREEDKTKDERFSNRNIG